MIAGLREAIFDASTQLGSEACDSGNHQWISEGGRGCPNEWPVGCSQTVYRIGKRPSPALWRRSRLTDGLCGATKKGEGNGNRTERG